MSATSVWDALRPELVEQANVTRLMRRSAAADYARAAPHLGRGARPLLARRRRRPRARVLDGRGSASSTTRAGPSGRRGSSAAGSTSRASASTAGPRRARDEEALVGLCEDGGRESLTWAEAVAPGDAARRGARRARRRARATASRSTCRCARPSPSRRTRARTSARCRCRSSPASPRRRSRRGSRTRRRRS